MLLSSNDSGESSNNLNNQVTGSSRTYLKR